MKTSSLGWATCALLFASAGLTTLAGPLRRGDVAAEPAWLVHLDCDGLRPTTIGQYLLAEMEKPEAQAKLAALRSLFSLDLRTQLHGLTLYGSGTNAQEGVLLVYAEFDRDRLVTLAKSASDAQQSRHKDQVIYSWIDEHKQAKEGIKARTYAAIYGPRVIFGQREEGVAQALDVLTGATRNLASGKVFPQLGASGNSSFLQAAARKFDFAAPASNTAVLKLAKLVRLQVAEAQGQVSALLTFEANDEEVAKNMASIAQGLVALMKLQKERPETVKVAEALSLKQDGPSLVIGLKFPADQVIEMIRADAARKAAKKAPKTE